jgi:hypothetical protein
MWQEGVAIFLIGISAVLAYISFQLGRGAEDEKNKKKIVFLQPLKWFLLSLSVVLLILDTGLAINMASDGGASANVLSMLGTSYLLLTWGGYIFISLIFIYMLWNIWLSIKKAKQGDDDE